MLLGCGTWLQYVTGNIVVDNSVSFTRRLWFGSAEINSNWYKEYNQETYMMWIC